ncbi:helix-turn-helix domain-containing protein [Dietzia massiliensis]|uniref:helix-turn-helix domain-containing protein n=1 Tax=Dietzia massiliensis TaxID=2697499 RepID=UPI001BCAE90C|nr:GAF domain-containing protein [Dietzia massiliensis]MBS7548334.1 GAF domain-containing protein [Dietzia massiliensis]
MSLHPTLRFSDPKTFAARSIEAHEIALSGGKPPGLDARVLRAWQRSGDAGISPDQQAPRSFLSQDELATAREMTPLHPVAAEVVASVADASAAGRHLVVVSDTRGRVLWRAGSAQTLRRADSIAFAEGADWSERGIGANGISLALESGALTHATAGEHFVRAHHGWTCTASPIRDRRGRVIGVLDVSHPLRFSSMETAALVRCGARLAESLLAALPSSPGTAAGPGHDDAAHEPGHDPVARSNPVTAIRLLGWKPAVIRADGTSIPLTPRRAELLALLASREAWSARALSEALYEDPTATTTVRGEVRRLRQLTGLSIDSQPYSLCPRERECVDFLSVEHPDDLLPDSEIPAIIDLRYGI